MLRFPRKLLRTCLGTLSDTLAREPKFVPPVLRVGVAEKMVTVHPSLKPKEHFNTGLCSSLSNERSKKAGQAVEQHRGTTRTEIWILILPVLALAVREDGIWQEVLPE